jgi:hypothetical protein
VIAAQGTLARTGSHTEKYGATLICLRFNKQGRDADD